MDIQALQQATREAVKKKFGRKSRLVSKVITHYPQNLEREYIRITDAYMKLFGGAVAAHVPDIRGFFRNISD